MGSVESRRKQIPVSVFSLQSTKCTINILFIMLVIKNSAIVSNETNQGTNVCLSHSFSFLKRETKTLLNTYLNHGHSLSRYIFLAMALKKLVTVQAKCQVLK